MAAEHGFSNHAIGSRMLGLSAILDLDGDGSDDIVIPADGRKALRLVSFAGGKFCELARFDVSDSLQDDFFFGDWNGNGRKDVAFAIDRDTVTFLSR